MNRNKHTVAHAWAHQHTSPKTAGNVSFEGPAFYSYGTQIGWRVDYDLCLYNATTYSSSTAAHQGAMGGAASHMRIIPVAFQAVRGFRFSGMDWDDLVTNYREQAQRLSQRAAASRKYKDMLLTEIGRMADDLEFLAGRDARDLPLRGKPDMRKIKPAIEKIRALANPSDEEIERLRERQAKEAKRARESKAAAQARRLRQAAEDIEDFKAGGVRGVGGLEFQWIRVSGDMVEATNHTQVPLADALRAYRLHKHGKKITGAVIGGYTIIKNTDDHIQIGCTKIKWIEIDSTLGALAAEKEAGAGVSVN